MKYRSLLHLVVICAGLAFMVSGLLAQDVKNDRIGTAAATELLIPVGARDMAMGGSGIAISSGVDAIFWNPAGLGRMTGSAQGMFSTMNYIADIRLNYGAVGLNFGGFGTVGISIKSMDFGNIPLTTADDPEGFAGRTFSPSFVVVGVTYGRAFTDAITAGGTLKLIREDMHRVTGSALAFDFGIQYHGVAGFQGLNLGVALKNVGPQVNFDGPGLLRLAQAADGNRPTQFFASNAASWELPTSVEIGVSYTRTLAENFSYAVNGSFANNNLALDSYKLGGEVKYDLGTLLVAGRGGIDLMDKGADDAQIFGPTLGFGLTYLTPGVDITLDYAYRQTDFFDSSSMFSLVLGF